MGSRIGGQVSQWKDRDDYNAQKLRVATPGVIQSFDPVKQTAVVQVCLLEPWRIATQTASSNGMGFVSTSAITMQDIKPLQDVPVVFPRAGGFALTFPVQAGDECLLVFGDSCIDSWYTGSATASTPVPYTCNPIELRRHDLSDAFAIVGIWNQQRVLADYSTDAVQIRSDDGTVYVEVGDTKVTIASSGDVTVNATSGTVTVNAMNTTVNASTCDINCENANVNASNSINMTANGTFAITGSQIILNSTGGGGTVVDGRTFLTHLHTLVAPGSGDSGPVL